MSTIKEIPKQPDSIKPNNSELSSTSIEATIQEMNLVKDEDQEAAIYKKDEARKNITSSNFATYEEAMAVAKKLQSRIDEIAKVVQKVTIRVDNETDQYIIEIKDPEGNVVKQFPSEKVLNLHQKLDDLSGMVIDEMI